MMRGFAAKAALAARFALLCVALFVAVVQVAAADVPSNAIRYTYDADGRLSSVNDPSQGAAAYDWDANGNLLSVRRFGLTDVAVFQVMPDNGAVGQTITIDGSGFSSTASQDAVTFNGSQATVTSATSTEVTVTVPNGATTGPVKVVTPSGEATSGSDFAVVASQAPTITSVSPTVVAPGDTITVQGTNLGDASSDRLLINETETQTPTGSGDSLSATVPTGAPSGPVVLTTPYGQAAGPDEFIAPPGYTPSQIGATGRLTMGVGTGVSIANGGQSAMLIFDGTRGQKVSITSSNGSFSQGSGLTLIGPNLTTITSINGNDLGPVVLPESGTYAVLLSPNGGATGSATVTAYDASDLTGQVTPSASGGSASFTTTAPGQGAQVTFSGTAGERVSVDMGSTMWYPYWALLGPDGSHLQGGELSQNNGTPTFGGPYTLPSSGTYTVAVEPLSGNATTGAVTVTVYQVPADLSGSLALSPQGASQPLSFGTPGQNASLTFSGTAGQKVSMALSNWGMSSGTWMNTAIVAPDGSTVSGSSQQYSSNNLMSPVTLPSTGTYTIDLDPQGGTGNVTVTAYDASDVVASVTPSASGGSASFTTTAPGQNARLTFSGTAGERVEVQLSGVTGFSSGVFGNWSLLAPDSSTLVSGGMPSDGGTAGPFTLPSSGTYTVLTAPSGAQTGSVTWTVYDVPADLSGSLQPSAAGASQSLSFGTPGQTAGLTFSGTQGQKVSLVVSNWAMSSGANANVSITAPDGSTVGSTAGFSGNGFFDAVTLPSTGIYTISVDPRPATGSFTLTAYDASDLVSSVTPSTSGGSATLTTTAPGQNAQLTFSGTAGERIDVQLSGVTGFSSGVFGNWSLLAPDSSTLFSGGMPSDGGTAGPFTLPTSGTYTVLTDPSGTQTGSVTWTVYVMPAGAADVSGGGARPASGAAGNRLPAFALRKRGGSGCTYHHNSQGRPTCAPRRKPRANEHRSGHSVAGAVRGMTPAQRLSAAYARALTSRSSRRPPLGRTARRPTRSAPAGVLPARRVLTRPAQTKAPATILSIESAWALTAHPPDQRLLIATSKGVSRGADSRAMRTAGRAAGSPPRTGRASYSPASTGHGISPDARASAAVRTALARAAAYRPRSGPGWMPAARAFGGNWTSHEAPTPWTALPALRARARVTALAGQALTVNGMPLRGVRLAIAGTPVAGRTDWTGRFLLTRVPAGHQVLLIDGNHVSARAQYGTYEVAVNLARARTTALDYTIWLTRLDPAGNATIKSPTKHPTVLRTRRIPGFEVRLPAGTVIHAANGKLIKHLNITPLPVDRAPFPVPPFLDVPTYFTVQPGGAYLSEGAQIIYPNYGHLSPGTRVAFWNYNASDQGWYVYGHGTVSHNGKQVVPDPGVRVWQLTGAMITGAQQPPNTAPAGCGCSGGDPVDLGSGLFLNTQTDLSLPDSLPLTLSRTYRQLDTNSYSFGVGTASNFDIRLWSNQNYQTASLVLPDGGQVAYVRTSPGTGWLDAIYTATGPRVTDNYAGSTIHYDTSIPDGGGWDLTLRSGLTYVFGDNAPLQAIRDRNGNQITLTRTNGQTGNITQITAPHGRSIRLTYDTSNRITQAQDNTGRTVAYTYTLAGYLATATDPMGRETTYDYDSSGDMTSIGNPQGYATTIAYYTNCGAGLGQAGDSTSQIRRKQAHLTGTCIDGAVEEESNSTGQGAYWFAYGVSQSGQIISTEMQDPVGNTEQVNFNSSGDPTTVVQGAGSDAEQTTINYETGSSLVQSVTDPLGRTTAYSYDNVGNLTGVTQMAGSEPRTWTYNYDSSNDLTSATDPLNHTATFGYDASGNLTSATDPVGRQTTIGYNSSGQPTTITDSSGNATTLQYLGGDLTGVTDPLGRTTTAYVDAAGRTLAVTDPAGNTTHYTYDADNELTKITDPQGGQTSLSYDPDGNLTQLTDPRGSSTSYAYDYADRLTAQTDALNRTSSWAYNGDGNVTSYQAPNGQTTSVSYDDLGRPSELQYPSSSISYTYDAANRPTTVTDSATGTYNNTYDAFDNLTSQTGPNGTVSYTYDAANRRVAMTTSAGVQDTYTYDAADDLTSVTGAAGTADATYDPAGRLATLTLPDGINENYTYDPASELSAITYTKGASQLGDLNYAYNADGQQSAVWGSYARTGLPAPIASLTYDADNELTSTGNTTYTYDSNGNLTNDGTNTYNWNDRNELTAVNGTGGSSTFTYDPFGRRNSQISNDTTTNYLYDGPNVLQELSATGPSAQILSGPGIDNVLARTTAAGTDSYLTDALGSTIQLADQNGNPTTSYTYDPFGQTTSSGPSSTNPYQYAGGVNDGNGLQYNLARYYNPVTASFTSQDPIGAAGSGTNLYAYAGDDPIDNTDPTGLIFGIPGTPSWSQIGTRYVGFVDGFTSPIFGGTAALRNAFDANGGLNTCSFDYQISRTVGQVDGAVESAAAAGWGMTRVMVGRGLTVVAKKLPEITSPRFVDLIAQLTGHVWASVARAIAFPVIGTGSTTWFSGRAFSGERPF